ncbi:fimbrial protein [Superficieibacter electus]|uniref:Fimbrial protein n=1 Tax=Superficieibacter electus TaxID=2022662 RepID=A0A2P5GMF8_9ENTR|nr:fimbrial protein [Superficieibacter electus]POP41593.1 fimbrial protein [Superficieibacter electus]POP47022.1 fimbrial protein [Superficieibacter electus]
MKKTMLLAAMLTAIGSGSAMADDVQGGQLQFNGLISATTCSKIVRTERGDSNTDGQIYLDSATPAEVTTEIQTTATGAKPEPFSIILDCKDATEVTETTIAKLKMDSTFSNTKGTLNNDANLTVSGIAAAKDVDIAIHHDKDGSLTQMKVDGADTHDATFNASKVATYDFIASYVKASATATVTPGHVTTNAMYTFTYQ